jgi:hypothetical protein
LLRIARELLVSGTARALLVSGIAEAETMLARPRMARTLKCIIECIASA